jgi:trk system potassium uptake protein TrkA
MRVIILGAGQVGSNLARKMAQENHDVVIIDTQAEKIQVLQEQLDILGLIGDGVSLPVLLQAGIDAADLFVAVTRNDSINILACVMAREFGVKRKVARIRDNTYSAYPDKLDLAALGIDFIIHPEDRAADNIVTLIRQTSATDILEVGGGKMQIIGVKVDAAFLHQQLRLQDLPPAEGFAFRTVAIKRKNQTLVPTGTDQFLPDDFAYFLVDAKKAKALLKYLGKPQRRLKNIMILGASRIGRAIARRLQDELNIKIIDNNKQHSRQAADELTNTLVVYGDGTDLDLLVQEGIIEMDVLIAATADDETNFIATLLGKHLQVPRTISIVNNAYYMPITPTIGLDAVVSPQTLIVNQIAKYIRSEEVASIASIPGVSAEAIDLIAEAGAAITKGPLQAIAFPRGAILGGVVHAEKDVEIAIGSTEIKTGDRAIVFCLPHALGKVEKLFRSS